MGRHEASALLAATTWLGALAGWLCSSLPATSSGVSLGWRTTSPSSSWLIVIASRRCRLVERLRLHHRVATPNCDRECEERKEVMDCPVCGEKLKEIERYGRDGGHLSGRARASGSIGARSRRSSRWRQGGIGRPPSSARPRSAIPRSLPRHGERDDRDDHDDDHMRDDHDHYDRDSRSGESGYGKPKKRRSLLGDILGGLGGE